MYQRPQRIETARIALYTYWGFFDKAPRGTRVWVDLKRKHPDPLRKLLWGYSKDHGTVSDYKDTFRKEGKTAAISYDITEASTAMQEQELRSKAIYDYVEKEG